VIKTEKKELYKEILDWALHILIAFAIGIFIVTFIAQRTIVYNISMEPTLYDGENLIVDKISPRLGRIKPGDIVTIKNASDWLHEEGKTIIKRVIAVAGDSVEIKDGKVYVNGEELHEDYIKGNYTNAMSSKYSNITVPEGHVYVLGDNRSANIVDSRTIGPVSLDKIESRAVIRIYPFDRIGLLK
jgi:signal peptidase I